MKKFLVFLIIWINVYQDIHEIIASVGMNILVAIGFYLDYKQNK